MHSQSCATVTTLSPGQCHVIVIAPRTGNQAKSPPPRAAPPTSLAAPGPHQSSLHPCICPQWSLVKTDHRICGLGCPVSCAEPSISEVRPCCDPCQSSVPVHGSVALHCVCATSCLPSAPRWGVFPLMCMLLWTFAFTCFGGVLSLPRTGRLAGSDDSAVFIVGPFSKPATSFCVPTREP